MLTLVFNFFGNFSLLLNWLNFRFSILKLLVDFMKCETILVFLTLGLGSTKSMKYVFPILI